MIKDILIRGREAAAKRVCNLNVSPKLAETITSKRQQEEIDAVLRGIWADPATGPGSEAEREHWRVHGHDYMSTVIQRVRKQVIGGAKGKK
ncbi:hypothetical protein A2379_02955 [Candidatus Amesbacteria bacterium RIFOXYB1_FULL_47_13]|nr:MAG: hypothetical protein A2379_02955 [Candidatus Amesbacteria bacterium RIFOXYB1_FULL_47_13]HBC72384.1 hypothetical protein [Candidatus Amesbacteria bacterium]